MDSKPALYGGEPVFKELVHIIRPTLVNPDDIRAAIDDIFASGNVTNSSYVDKFEKAAAEYIGVRHVMAVGNATSGLMLALKGLALSGEVIVPSFTFTATIHALSWNNLKPVFVDCEERTYSIDPLKIKEKITQKTSAIMPVYIYGNPPDIDMLTGIARAHNLKLIFDSAQGFGSEYRGIKAGNFGDCEVFSLSPTKVLTSFEGGLVVTNNDDLALFLRKGRDYGKGSDDIDHVGLSARMSEIHALIGLSNLRNIEQSIAVRRSLIQLYRKLLESLPGIHFQEIIPGNKTSGNYMVIFIDQEKFGMDRDELYKSLGAENIQTKKYFYPAVHMQKAYLSMRILYQSKLPVTEKAAEEGLALPLYGHMEAEIVERVCRAIKRIYEWNIRKSPSLDLLRKSNQGGQARSPEHHVVRDK